MDKGRTENVGIRVAMVSTYFVRCGIFTYSRHLNEALAKLDCDVYGVRLPRFGIKNQAILQTVVENVPVDKVDLIHVQHEYGLYQGLEQPFYSGLVSLGKPIVTTMHSVGAWEVDKIVAEASTRIIVHNEFCFRRFAHPEKTGIIPHGACPLETPPPPKEECKRLIGIDPRTPLVGYVGFITSPKGLEMLIEAMIKVPNAGLLIGGGWHVERETEYIFKLKEWTLKDLPARCRWLGYIADRDLATVYGALDLVVYPSRFATESGALIMALSHGKAVIASNVAPFKEKEKVGALITFNDVKDLTRKIKRLLSNEQLKVKLEEGAKKYAEDTSWSRIAQKHLTLYKQLLIGDKLV